MVLLILLIHLLLKGKTSLLPPTPLSAVGGTEDAKLAWDQPCNPHQTKEANPVPTNQPKSLHNWAQRTAVRHTHTCSCKFNHH